MSSVQSDQPFRGNLRYPDGDPVRLDVTAIIARGSRIRRRRVTRVTAAMLTVVVVPAAIALSWLRLVPQAGPAQAGAAQAGPGQAGAMNGGYVSGPQYGGVGDLRAAGTYRAANEPVFGVSRLAHPDVLLRVRASVTLPSGYNPISALAGDQGGSGAWFWDAARSQVKVFHLSRAGTLRSWPARGVPADVRAGFAVTRAGVAWLAVRSTLARLDTRTGHERTWHIPAPRDNPAADGDQPPGTGHDRPVQALAVSATGLVAVADANASSVQVLDLATGRFRQVLMPSPHDVPQAVGFARDGTLGIGYQHVGSPHVSGVLLDPVAGPDLNLAVTESFAVTADGASSLLVGVSRPDVVSVSGQVRPLVLLANPIDTAGAVQPPAWLPGRRLASIVGAGILAFPADARSVSQAWAQSVLYIPPVIRCEHLAADARGDLWIVGGSGGRTVDLLVPS